ncbi:uncharacterized [Tachysurus ichikawai]
MTSMRLRTRALSQSGWMCLCTLLAPDRIPRPLLIKRGARSWLSGGSVLSNSGGHKRRFEVHFNGARRRRCCLP